MKRRTVSILVVLALTLGLLVGRFSVGLPTAVASHSSAGSPYAPFVGTWYHHGGGLVLSSNGRGFYTYRTYVDCTARIVTACDKGFKNLIFDGGFSEFTLNRTIGNKAYGTMNSSAYSWQVKTTVTLVAKPNHTLILYEAATPATTLCGPKAPAGLCGA